MEKRALITGITGQDGSYLAEFLLEKGYEVHGIKRRTSTFNTSRIDHIYSDPHENQIGLHLHRGDLNDTSSLVRVISHVKPDEIYNLAAQSHGPRPKNKFEPDRKCLSSVKRLSRLPNSFRHGITIVNMGTSLLKQTVLQDLKKCITSGSLYKRSEILDILFRIPFTYSFRESLS